MSEWIGEARRHAELLMRDGDLVLHTLFYNLITDIERAETWAKKARKAVRDMVPCAMLEERQRIAEVLLGIPYWREEEQGE